MRGPQKIALMHIIKHYGAHLLSKLQDNCFLLFFSCQHYQKVHLPAYANTGVLGLIVK